MSGVASLQSMAFNTCLADPGNYAEPVFGAVAERPETHEALKPKETADLFVEQLLALPHDKASALSHHMRDALEHNTEYVKVLLRDPAAADECSHHLVKVADYPLLKFLFSADVLFGHGGYLYRYEDRGGCYHLAWAKHVEDTAPQEVTNVALRFRHGRMYTTPTRLIRILDEYASDAGTYESDCELLNKLAAYLGVSPYTGGYPDTERELGQMVRWYERSGIRRRFRRAVLAFVAQVAAAGGGRPTPFPIATAFTIAFEKHEERTRKRIACEDPAIEYEDVTTDEEAATDEEM